MQFKLLVVFVEDAKTTAIIEAAREAGATGSLVSQTDVVLLLVERHLSRHILEEIGAVGEFDQKPGTGIAIQIDVEDAIGVMRQAEELAEIVEEQL